MKKIAILTSGGDAPGMNAAIRAVEADPSHSIDNITDEITNFIKGTATGATVILATDSAIKMAESNVEIAKKIQQALREEESLMKLLSDHLGKRDAKKFKKKIDAAAKNTKLHQLKVKLFHHQYDSLQECVESTLNAFKHFNLDTLRMGKQLLKNEYTGKVIKTVAKGEVELAKHNIKKKIDKVVPTTKKPKIKPRTGVNAPLGEFIFGTNKK